MGILQMFGFNWFLFIAQMVNFLVLLYLFKRFLYKPVLKTLRDREKKIAAGLEDAEKAEKALSQAETERNAILKQASIEAQGILNDTKKAAEEIRQGILNESKREADKIIAHAHQQAVAEMATMRKQAAHISLEMSQKILDNVLEKLFSKKEKDELVKKGIEQIKKYE